MKLSVVVLLITCMLCGCRVKDDPNPEIMELRKSLLSADSCSFDTVITADYGDKLYTFKMNCQLDADGTLSFSVIDPESIAGITGRISDDGAALTFDDKVLAFPVLADDQLTPVCAPWIFINTLKSGYFSGSSSDEDGFCLYMEDSFSDQTLHLEVYTDHRLQPNHADFFWNQQRVLSAEIRNFSIQ